MHYICPDCRHPIGLMANEKGNPISYRCIYTGRLQPAQEVVSRETSHPGRGLREDA